MYSQVLAPWKPGRPGEDLHPHAENEYLIPWAHSNLQLIETFIISQKQNFHQRIYKRQRHIELYYDLFQSRSHLLLEDCLLNVIWTTTHFSKGFPICLFPWTSSTKILLYTMYSHVAHAWNGFSPPHSSFDYHNYIRWILCLKKFVIT